MASNPPTEPGNAKAPRREPNRLDDLAHLRRVLLLPDEPLGRRAGHGGVGRRGRSRPRRSTNRPHPGGLKIAYAVGQLVNGQLAERISPRLLLAIGMFGSAALNVVFGFSTALYFLLFVWATNGYCQSLGWTPSIRVVANWIPVVRRGKAIGFVGTGYQLAGVLTFVVAGQAAELFGWRGALFVPAGILVPRRW